MGRRENREERNKDGKGREWEEEKSEGGKPIYKSSHLTHFFKIFSKVSILYFLIVWNDHLLLQ